MKESALIITLAYILDILLGDPPWLPHPVRGIGWMIRKSENVFRRIKNERAAGILFALFIIAVSYLLTFCTVFFISSVNEYAGMAASIFFVYSSLSVRDLKKESMAVYSALKNDGINSARRNLSKIVGRDTADLSDKEIVRATVETIAENTVDGIISPLFFAFLGGAPLAMAYKAVNTLDSMVGYKNGKYKIFGWASAKIDDVFNFIPARLSAILLPLACALGGGSFLNSVKTVFRDGGKNPSPNSGIPEAAFAGGLKIRLGGLNFYNRVPQPKPFIGDDINPLRVKHIRQSIKISYICSATTLVLGLVLLASTRRGIL